MKAVDFEYDDMLLSDFGFMICTFEGGKGSETVSDSQISINTVSVLDGSRRYKTSAVYENCIEITFQICKIPKNKSGSDRMNINFDEVRKIKRWLERKEFCKFRFVDQPRDYSLDFYYEGIFNVSQIEIANEIIGLELTLITNRPYAIHDPIKYKFEWTDTEITQWDENGDSIYRNIIDNSDEVGCIYPKVTITCLCNGVFSMCNYMDEDNGWINIRNCKKGEVITMEYPLIKSSDSTHDLANDFNYVFLRIGNNFRDRVNQLELELPAIIEIEYNPVIKVGI